MPTPQHRPAKSNGKTTSSNKQQQAATSSNKQQQAATSSNKQQQAFLSSNLTARQLTWTNGLASETLPSLSLPAPHQHS